MSPLRVALSSLFLFFIFTVQEGAINRIQFPVTGFSFYLAVLIGMMALEEKSGAVIMGFIGGIILDLAPTTNSPFGQWALVLTIVGYAISANTESVGDFASRPGAFVLFVAFGAILTLILYLLVGAMVGENAGTFGRNLVVVIGNFIWTLLFTPIFLPLVSRIRTYTMTSRERT
jgi:rod shape-determining protein MreD